MIKSIKLVLLLHISVLSIGQVNSRGFLGLKGEVKQLTEKQFKLQEVNGKLEKKLLLHSSTWSFNANGKLKGSSD